MADEINISQITKDMQERMFRVALSRGLTFKAISLESGIPLSTLRTYSGTNGATAEMPVSALRKLLGVMPDDLLSMLLPETHALVRVPDGVNHDEFEEAARAYLVEKARSHHPDSPGGREISECEERSLGVRLALVRAA